MRLNSQLSSANAIIKFNGTEVGWISSLSFSQNFNQAPVKHLRSYASQGFIRGSTDVNVSAQKAFIEMSAIFGQWADFYKFTSAQNDVSNGNEYERGMAAAERDKQVLNGTISAIDNITGTTFASDLVNPILQAVAEPVDAISNVLKQWFSTGDPWAQEKREKKVRSELTKALKKGLSNNLFDIFSRIFFDIEILAPVDQLTGITPGGSTPIWTLKDCKMAAQEVSITNQSVIVLQGMTMVARDVQESYVESEINKS